MQSLVFNYPFEKVYRGAKMVMHNKGYNVVTNDHDHGTITFEKKKFLILPDVKATLNLEKINAGIRVVIDAKVRGVFFTNAKRAAQIENRIVEVMASII